MDIYTSRDFVCLQNMNLNKIKANASLFLGFFTTPIITPSLHIDYAFLTMHRTLIMTDLGHQRSFACLAAVATGMLASFTAGTAFAIAPPLAASPPFTAVPPLRPSSLLTLLPLLLVCLVDE